MNTKTHPSAEWIYNELKPKYPKLSLATVYRNINELVKENKVVSLGKVLDKERYDGDTSIHTHAVCAVCGKIIDVSDISLPKDVVENSKQLKGFAMSYSRVEIIGICDECKGKAKKNKYEKN